VSRYVTPCEDNKHRDRCSHGQLDPGGPCSSMRYAPCVSTLKLDGLRGKQPCDRQSLWAYRIVLCSVSEITTSDVLADAYL